MPLALYFLSSTLFKFAVIKIIFMSAYNSYKARENMKHNRARCRYMIYMILFETNQKHSQYLFAT